MENKIVCKKIKISIPLLKLDSKVKTELTEKKDLKVKEDLLDLKVNKDLKELMVLLSLKISFSI
jgi:hypothetical protein